MRAATFLRSAVGFLFVAFLAFHVQVSVDAAISTTTLVTEFPHFQTFDSWDVCSFDGPCYAQSCDSLLGGWLNPEFHTIDPPTYNGTVYNWWVNKGPTTSNYNFTGNVAITNCSQVVTGPCYDHTMANSSGGYLYAEASACQEDFLIVLSPPVEFSNSGALLSFWYYMFGSDLNINRHKGRLEVAVSVEGGAYLTFFNHSGDSQTRITDPWVQVNQSLDSFFPSNINENNTVTAQFRFRAFIAGDDDAFWRADIAIDDVLFTQNGASSDLVPYVDPPPQNNTQPVGPTAIDTGGDGISGGQIAGIVIGVVGGLLLCCLFLTALVIGLLLLISPRKPGGRRAPVNDAVADEL